MGTRQGGRQDAAAPRTVPSLPHLRDLPHFRRRPPSAPRVAGRTAPPPRPQLTDGRTVPLGSRRRARRVQRRRPAHPPTAGRPPRIAAGADDEPAVDRPPAPG